MRAILLLLFITFLVSCQSGYSEANRSVEMYNASGDMVGTAKLSEQDGGVQVTLSLEGLEPGFHGVHVHEFPKCEGPDFTSAGNHFNPDGKEHGLMHPEGSHLGDLPNVEADGSGIVEAELMLAEATLKDGKKSILRGEGTSLIVHDGQDDGVSQPGGESGNRILCGVIKTDPDPQGEKTPTDPTEFNEEQEK